MDQLHERGFQEGCCFGIELNSFYVIADAGEDFRVRGVAVAQMELGQACEDTVEQQSRVVP